MHQRPHVCPRAYLAVIKKSGKHRAVDLPDSTKIEALYLLLVSFIVVWRHISKEIYVLCTSELVACGYPAKSQIPESSNHKTYN